MATTPSTQDRVRARARRGTAAGWCCVAAEQTAGRGRQGRPWVADAGAALLTSILLRPSAAVLHLVPLAGGVAAVEALEAATGLVAGLKWPNDVLVGGAKLAGLLAEVEPLAPGGTAVVLGMGLNLRVGAFPPGAHGVSLHEAVTNPPPWDSLLAAWLGALGAWLERIERHGADPLLDAWRHRAVGLGGPVEASTPGGVIRGTASGIDRDGALLVSTPAGSVRLVAGDVHLTDSCGARADGADGGESGTALVDRPSRPEPSGPT